MEILDKAVALVVRSYKGIQFRCKITNVLVSPSNLGQASI